MPSCSNINDCATCTSTVVSEGAKCYWNNDPTHVGDRCGSFADPGFSSTCSGADQPRKADEGYHWTTQQTIVTPTADSIDALTTLVKESQEKERMNYALLEENAASVAAGRPPRYTDQEREKIITEINKESETRKNYYNLVEQLTRSQDSAARAADAVSKQQIEISRYLEASLNEAKKKFNEGEEKKQNQLKMVQINTYYGNLYESYGEVARTVAILAVLLLVALPFRTTMPGLASLWNKTVLYGGGFYLFYVVIDYLMRRNDDFEEYTFPNAPTDAKSLATSGKPIIDISGVDVPTICAGQFCCGPGTTWDDELGCVISSARGADLDA
jgi:hypothetical protein